jgi:phytoene desaturase
VVNADATAAIKRFVPEHLRPGESDARVDAKRYSCSTYMLYLGLEGEVDLPHHTIYVSGRYDRNLEEITTVGTTSEDPSVYACNPSRLDPTLAPEGCSALYVLMPTPNTRTSEGRIDWSAERAAARERVLHQLERRMGIADIRSRIRVEHEVTPEDWRKGADGIGPINHGATFNLAHNLGQMLHRRVAHEYERVPGLYFCGGGTHPGSGLPVIFLSAQITARLVCERMGLGYAGDRAPRMHDPVGELVGA